MVLLYLKLVGFVLVQLLFFSVSYRIPEFVWGRSYKEKVYDPVVGCEVERTVDTRRKIHITGCLIIGVVWIGVTMSVIELGLEFVGDLVGVNLSSFFPIVLLAIVMSIPFVDGLLRKR